MLRTTKDGLIVQVKIAPNASKNEIIKTETGVKIKLTVLPVKGKANKALAEFLSKQLGIPKTSVEIIKGVTSKDKTLLLKIFDDDKIRYVRNVLD